jgi:hypothetical protein
MAAQKDRVRSRSTVCLLVVLWRVRTIQLVSPKAMPATGEAAAVFLAREYSGYSCPMYPSSRSSGSPPGASRREGLG